MSSTAPRSRTFEKKARNTRQHFFRPFVEALEDRTLLATNWSAFTTALGARLDQLSNSFQSTIASAQSALPILNQPLGSVAEFANTVKSFENPILNKLKSISIDNLTNAQAQTAIQDALYDVLTAANILGDTDGVNGVTKDDVKVTGVDVAAGNVTIEVRLTSPSLAAASQNFGFGLGLPGLPFEIDGKGQIAITTGFDYKNLKFGLSGNSFFLDTSGADELTASVNASVVSPSMHGIIGFLDMDATPNTAGGTTGLSANLTLDVQSPTSDSIVVANPRLGGSADINLTLTGSFNSAARYQVPSIATDLQMHWDFDGGDPTKGALGAEPSVNFNNVRVSLGQFLSNMVAPLVEDVKVAVGPIMPIIELLNARLPGVSDLSETAGLGSVSLLTIAKAAESTAALPPDIKLAVEILTTATELLDIVNNASTVGGNVYLTVGSFNLNQLNGDLRNLPSLTNGQSLRSVIGNLGAKQDLTQLASIAQEQITKFEQLVSQSGLPSDVKNRIAPLVDEIKYKLDQVNNGVKLEFPFIENPKLGVFNLLLGRDADFVTLTTKLVFKQHVEDPYDLFKVGPVQVQGFVTGDVDLNLFLRMGYDSYGLRQLFRTGKFESLLNGFYLDSSQDLLRFKGGVGVGLRGELPVFGFVNPLPVGPSFVGVKIGPEFTGGVHISGSDPNDPFYIKLIDPNNDGKVRVFEEAVNQPQLFQTDGQLIGDLKADFVARTPFPLLSDVVLYHKDIASQTLLDLSSQQTPYTANPFFQIPGQPVKQAPVVTDLNFVPKDGSGHDGIPNYLTLRVERAADGKDHYRLYFQNGLVVIDGSSIGSTLLLEDKPLDSISTIQLLGASDDDIITIDGNLGKDVIIDARNGKNSLMLNSPIGGVYSFQNGLIKVPGRHTVTYKSIGDITLTASSGLLVSFINEVAAGTKLTINGSPVRNVFNIGGTSMQAIRGDLTLRGGAGDDSMVFYDRANTDQTTWTINDTTLQRICYGFRPAQPDENGVFVRPFVVDVLSFDLSAIEHVTINGGDKVDNLLQLVNGNLGQRYELMPNAASDVTIVGGTGDDTYVFGSETLGLNAAMGGRGNFNFAIQDRGGYDSLYVNDRATLGTNDPGTISAEFVYTINTQYVMRDVYDHTTNQNDQPVTIHDHFQTQYAGLDSVNLYGGNVDASYVLSGFGGAALAVYPGAADDQVNLGTFSNFKGSVNLRDLGGVDELQINKNDVVYIDDTRISGPSGFSANYAGFESLRVNSPAHNTYMEVRSLAPDVAATIFGAASVKVGTGFLSNVRGSVDILTGDGITSFGGSIGNLFTALTIDDSADPLSTTFAIDSTSVSASRSFSKVDFAGADLTSLTLSAGAGGNQVTLADTRSSAFTGPITLNTGLGADVVNIQRTKTSVTVNGQNGADTVNAGVNGDMQGINALVTIGNAGAWSAVNLDDSADPVARNVTLDNVSGVARVTGLAPAIIRVRTSDLSALTIAGGGGNDTFAIVDTPLSKTFPGGTVTNLRTGGGDDTVNVRATTGKIAIQTQAGANTVNIGRNNALDAIKGAVRVDGLGGTAIVNVNDQATITPQQFTLQRDSLTRANATLTSSIGFDNLARLNVSAGSASDSFLVLGSPTGAVTTLRGGAATDTATIFGSDGELIVDLGTGAGQSVTIGDTLHSLDAIHGKISVFASGAVDAFVSNAACTQSQSINIKSGTGQSGPYETLERTQFATDHYDSLNFFSFYFSGAAHFHYYAGQNTDTVFLLGSPANFTNSLFGGANPDYFWIEGDQVPLLGPVFVEGGTANNDNAFYYDYLNPTSQTYTFHTIPGAGNLELVERPGAATVSYRGVGQIIFYAAYVGGNTANVQGLPAPVFLNSVAGPNDVFNLGSNAPNQAGTVADLLGPISVAGNDHVQVIVDDSAGSTARQVTLTPKQDAYGDHITGLIGSVLYTRLDDTSSVTILGGQGDDSFAVNGTDFDPAVRIDGGGGTNSLDYSAVTDGVYVNLQTGTASGLKGGIANIQNVTGGAGNDILVGYGANVLSGGDGRDILIAGGVADGAGVPLDVPFPGSALNGGNGEDLLIGGVTVYDTDKAALDALMAEWSGPDLYDTRVNTLRNGLLAPGKVSWNGLQNTLNGQADPDLHFGSAARDLYTTEPGEVFVGV